MPVEANAQARLDEIDRKSSNEKIDPEVLKRIDSLIEDYQEELTQEEINSLFQEQVRETVKSKDELIRQAVVFFGVDSSLP